MSLPELNDLSERERDILRLVATGAGNKQIAAQLFISTNTVKVHLRNIFAKIGVNSRTEAAMVAIRLGLVEPVVPEEANGSETADLSQAGGTHDTIATSAGGATEMATAPRRMSRRQALGMGFGALSLIIVLGILGLLRTSGPGLSPQVTSSPAPRITPLPRWQTRSNMPVGRMDLAAVAFNDQVYAIGGETADGVTGAVERYDPAADQWESLQPMPLPVADVQAVVIGGRIYVPGGRTSTGGPTDILEIYDPAANRWEEGTNLPTALSAYAICAFEGQLYLFGGWNGSQYNNQAYVYDPRLNTWTALSPMPTRRAFGGAALAGGKIYVIGGKNEQGALTAVEIYSPDREGRENPWQDGTPLPQGRFGMGVSSVADIIYVVGGLGNTGAALPSLAHIPQTDTWQSFDTPSTNQSSGGGLAISGEYLYMMGGKTGSVPLPNLQAYQIVYTVGIPVIIK